MKKLLFILLVGIITNAATAQEYLPLATEKAHWFICKYDINNPYISFYWEYFTMGDTTINDTYYKKVYKVDLEPVEGTIPLKFERVGSPELYGFIRDDADKMKVFSIVLNNNIFCPENEEYLLYDFSVDQGDTVNMCLVNFMAPDTVSNTIYDSIFGLFTKQITLSKFLQDPTYFEGIGSAYGLFEEFYDPLKEPYEVYLYDYCRNDSCDLLAGIHEQNVCKKDKIKVFPNPFIDQINIQSNIAMSNQIRIKIFDLLGREVINEITLDKHEKRFSLDLSNLNQGIYLLMYANGADYSHTKRIVKH